MSSNASNLKSKIKRIKEGLFQFKDRLEIERKGGNSLTAQFLQNIRSAGESPQKKKSLKIENIIAEILLVLYLFYPEGVPLKYFSKESGLTKVTRQTIVNYIDELKTEAISNLPWLTREGQKNEKLYLLKDEFFYEIKPLVPRSVAPASQAPLGTIYLESFLEEIDRTVNFVQNSKLQELIAYFLKHKVERVLVLIGKKGYGKTRQCTEILCEYLDELPIWVVKDPNELQEQFFKEIKDIHEDSIFLIDNLDLVQKPQGIVNEIVLQTNLTSNKWIFLIKEKTREETDFSALQSKIIERVNLFDQENFDTKEVIAAAKTFVNIDKKTLDNWWRISKGNWLIFITLCQETLESQRDTQQLERNLHVVITLIQRQLENTMEKYLHQGEVLRVDGNYQWLFPIRIVEKERYSYNKKEGESVYLKFRDLNRELYIILDQRGSGKTVASLQLQWFTLSANIESDRKVAVPIRLDLSLFSINTTGQACYDGFPLQNEEVKLENLLYAWWQAVYRNLSPEEQKLGLKMLPWMEKLASSQSIFLILDAWDELEDQLEDDFLHFLKETLAQIPVIVTSREKIETSTGFKGKKTHYYQVALPTSDDIKIYFKSRWHYFGYNFSREHVDNVQKLNEEFKRPFNMHALSLLPPNSDEPKNTASLYRRMVHCIVLWEYLKRKTKRDYSSFSDYEDILRYMGKTRDKRLPGLNLVQLVKGTGFDNPIFKAVGKIAHDAYWRDSPIHDFHQVCNNNPLAEYFVGYSVDKNASIFKAILSDKHLYPYFAAEYVYHELLQGGMVKIPVGEVLDLFEEILKSDPLWKNSQLGQYCEDPQEIILEYHLNKKLIGKRQLKTGFDDGTFMESYRWGTGEPAYVNKMRSELIKAYKELKQEKPEKKHMRSLLRELIFDPPQHYMASGYDSIIKDWDQRFGISKEPYAYHRRILNIHGLGKKSSLDDLIKVTPYGFTFYWIHTDHKGQVTPNIAGKMWERYNQLSDGEAELAESIMTVLLAIDYEPVKEQFIAKNLNNNDLDILTKSKIKQICNPLPLKPEILTTEAREWLLFRADPRQISKWWTSIVAKTTNLEASRILLSQGEYTEKLLKYCIEFLENELTRDKSENQEEDPEEDDDRFDYDDLVHDPNSWEETHHIDLPEKTGSFETILGPLLVTLLIRGKNEEKKLLHDLLSIAPTEWLVYLVRLARRWDLFWISDNLYSLVDSVKDLVTIEICQVLGFWGDDRAIQILKNLFTSKKLPENKVLVMLKTWPKQVRSAWMGEFIKESSEELWTGEYTVYSNGFIKFGLNTAETAMIEKITNILNKAAIKTEPDLKNLTVRLVRFLDFTIERMEKLFVNLHQRAKDALFNDMKNDRLYNWQKTFVIKHFHEISEFSTISDFLSYKDIVSDEKCIDVLIERLENYHWETISEEKDKGDFYSLNSMIKILGTRTKTKKRTRAFNVLTNIWERLPKQKLVLSSLTKVLLQCNFESAEKVLANKMCLANNIPDLLPIIEHLPATGGKEKFWTEVVKVLPDKKTIYQQIHHALVDDSSQDVNRKRDNQLSNFFRGLKRINNHNIINYLQELWFNCPDDLVYDLFEYLFEHAYSEPVLPLKNIIKRFSTLPTRVLWAILEKYCSENLYYSRSDLEKVFIPILVAKKEEFLNSAVTLNKKELVKSLLKNFHGYYHSSLLEDNENLLSLQPFFDRVKNPSRRREQWEKELQGIYIANDDTLSLDEIWTILDNWFREEFDEHHISDTNAGKILLKNTKKIEQSLDSATKREIIRKILCNIYESEATDALRSIFEAVKNPLEKQEYWENRWEERETSSDEWKEDDDEENNGDDDFIKEIFEELQQEGIISLDSWNKDPNSFKRELFSLNIDDFFSKLRALATAEGSAIAVELAKTRIKLLREAGTGWHGDGTAYWDYKLPYMQLREILLQAIIDEVDFTFDETGFLLEQLIITVLNIDEQNEEETENLYEFYALIDIWISTKKIFNALQKLPLNQLYPFMVLHSFDNCYNKSKSDLVHLKWQREVQNFLINKIVSEISD